MELNIIEFQDKKWLVKMEAHDIAMSKERLDWFKWYKGADMVLKNKGMLYFVEEIPDTEFEEINEKDLTSVN